jgi:hypothetical protein
LGATHLGRAMLVHGADIFTVESVQPGVSGKLWRISSDGGATWMVEDFAAFPFAPGTGLSAATVWNGRIYLLSEGGSVHPPEIWSVAAAPPTLPDPAVLEGTFPWESSCRGLAADDYHFYASCGGGRLVMLAHADAPNYQPEVLADGLDGNGGPGAMYSVETDADGIADVLYVNIGRPFVHYACDPSGQSYVDILATTGTADRGLGFDPVTNTLWRYDDTTFDLVSLH